MSAYVHRKASAIDAASASCHFSVDKGAETPRLATFDAPERKTERPVQHPYYHMILLIERLHRYFLEVVKIELDRHAIPDINNVQALILYNIGGDELTVGELTARGYYLGSNVSYNVKKMVENGYLVQERSQHDRRSVRVKLTRKGQTLRAKLGQMLEAHASALGEIDLTPEALDSMNEMLRRFERFWSNRVGYGVTGGMTGTGG
jgi:DNA-binding MarR family transcriptional regulator